MCVICIAVTLDIRKCLLNTLDKITCIQREKQRAKADALGYTTGDRKTV